MVEGHMTSDFKLILLLCGYWVSLRIVTKNNMQKNELFFTQNEQDIKWHQDFLRY
jgi:hypothetical protein